MIRKRNYFKIFCVIILISIFSFGIVTHFKNNKKVITIEKRVSNFYTTEGTRKMNDGVSYYIASDGTSTDGTNINDPLSLENAKKKTFYNNDNILFKSGDTFYGEVRFNIVKRENDDSLCYITSYGEGEPPKITTAKIIDNKDSWEKYSDNVYRVNLKDKTKFKGFQNIDDNSCNIGFIKAQNGNIYGARKNELSSLKDEYDFYCDNTYLYIFVDNNPFNKLGIIKLPTRYNLFAISSYCEISNLHLELSGAHGLVKNSTPLTNSYIHNCIINDIGGSFFNGNLANDKVKFGNAIEFWNDTNNVLIEKNMIDNTYDAGITLQGDEGRWDNIIIRNNIIKKSNYPFELWATGKSKGMTNIEISNNLIIDQGESWAKYVKPDQKVSSDFVFWAFDDAKSDIKIVNNNFWNSNRLFFITSRSKKELKEMVFDSNEYYNDSETYTYDKIKEEDPKTYLYTTYKICDNDRFYEINESFMDKVSKIDHNSINYDYLWNCYNELDKEYKQSLLSDYIDENERLCMRYNDFIKDQTINEKYNNLINCIKNISDDTDNINMDKLNSIYNYQIQLYITTLEEVLYNKLVINSETFDSYKNDMEALLESYKDIVCKFHKSEKLDKNAIKEKLNNVIERYNSNLDLDESDCTKLIEIDKELYENGTETDNLENNYYNLLKILNDCDIINTLLDYNINKNIEINIEENKDGSCKPVVKAEKIEDVELYKENQKVNYNLGDSIFEAGVYTINIKNYYGFTNSIKFVQSKKHEKNGDDFKYITIRENLNLDDIKINENNKLFNEEMKEKGENEIIKTGDIFQLNSENYYLIVKGDVDKDGKCTIMDLIKIRKKIVDVGENDDLQNIAADLCEDNIIDIKDLIKMRHKLIE